MIEKILESLRPVEKKVIDTGNYENRYIKLANYVKWYFDNISTTNQKRFVVSEKNRQVIDLLLSYFSEHPFFLESKNKTREKAEEYSFDKSILLIGPIGCGKTDIMIAIMKAISYYANNNQDEEEMKFWKKKEFSIDFCAEFEPRFSLEGYEMTKKFKANKNFFLDDLGHEDVSSNYNNKDVNVAGMILISRYNMSKFQDCKTHYTTNLYLESKDPNAITIESKYGDREKNRFFETHNLIYFPNDSPSLRKKL